MEAIASQITGGGFHVNGFSKMGPKLRRRRPFLVIHDYLAVGTKWEEVATLCAQTELTPHDDL